MALVCLLVDAMRSVLALGLLVVLYASASAATVHHSKRRHAIVGPSEAVIPRSYVAPNGVHIYRDDSVPGGFRTDHDEPPAFDDASKWGGE